MNQDLERGSIIGPQFEISNYNPDVDELIELKEVAKEAYQRNRDFFGKMLRE